MKTLYFLSLLILTSTLLFSFSTEVVNGIYDHSEIIEMKELTANERALLKTEVLDFLAQRANTSNPTELELINWEIYRRGYKHFLTKEIQQYIHQQVELKMIQDGSMEGTLEDEILANPYN